ncbi:MAG: hypothetical protein ACRCUS_08125, partial [Anaerovoracaceae bacterium]
MDKSIQTLNNPPAKHRDHFWDTFRGFCMWLIPISHFTMSGGEYVRESFGGVIYITINVFVMQAFVFLSGYFSKKPQRARETAFKTFLFPYLMLLPFFYCVRYIIYGDAVFSVVDVPFALWYLVALFYYKYFLIDYIKFKYILPVAILVYLLAGQVTFFENPFSLGRAISYFPFFI